MIVMCGISGMIGIAQEEDTIVKMLATMHHRGPDDSGVYRCGDAALLHARLAVIDLAGGRQPMEYSDGSESYIMVYNGELYNTQELRKELQRLGHCFQSQSDTEVLLHAYVQYGKECVNRVNGIFAFAVWEKNRKRLFLARDRIGVKPLFYKLHDGGLLFASEIKTILVYPTVNARLGENGAKQLLLLGPGRLPGSGILEGIQEVRPGFCGYYEGKQLRLSQYWKLTDREHTDSFEETSEFVRYLVTDAIKRQMVSDVPVGTFLSGGLDSSIISAVCAGEMRDRGETLKTFSVDYLNNHKYFQPSLFQPNSDNDYICQMQNFLQSDHQWCVLTSDELVEALESSTIARDLPGMADVDFSLFLFSKQVRRKVTVALSGECADEIFGGYPWYRDPEISQKAGFPWAQNTKFRSELLRIGDYQTSEAFVMDAYLQTCRESDILPGTSANERRMKEMVNLNFSWFMQTLLDRKDRMSMYHALEVRVPFCDYRIAEYLYSVPWEMKDYQGREKGLLRHAMRGLLPDGVLNRKKSPYPKTHDPRYEQLVSARLRELCREDSPLWYLVRKDKVQILLDRELVSPWYGQLMRRPQTIAYLLQLDFWLRHYQIDFCY